MITEAPSPVHCIYLTLQIDCEMLSILSNTDRIIVPDETCELNYAFPFDDLKVVV